MRRIAETAQAIAPCALALRPLETGGMRHEAQMAGRMPLNGVTPLKSAGLQEHIGLA